MLRKTAQNGCCTVRHSVGWFVGVVFVIISPLSVELLSLMSQEVQSC